MDKLSETEKLYQQYVEKAKKDGDTDIKSRADWHDLVFGKGGM